MQPAKIVQQRNSGLNARKCERCRIALKAEEDFFIVDSTNWHVECFMCAQCMIPIAHETFFQIGNRLYCEHDFRALYSPICSVCDDFIDGQVIRALNSSFHPKCFRCEFCDGSLSEGIYRNAGKMICFTCNQLMPKAKIYNCKKCHQTVDDEDLLLIEFDPYHAYHFNCTNCDETLTNEARQANKKLLCKRCYDFQCEICFACKTPIDPLIERSTLAMGKHWHVEHFRCSICGVPFHGKDYFEKNQQPYCRSDFAAITGMKCFYCNSIPKEDVMIDYFGKKFCRGCYRCRFCDKLLKYKDKVAEFDMLPVCKKCIGGKNFQKMLKEHKTR
ncbi:unnamed protein product [Caenorhabditis bovis]|uniref:LIM zinc-binding domain-containing protein n=1 Tax=Caenorhabditis bovis TaxID=2654633 RepID=A0A8S1FAD2_9PELO|nr:unnamed protein product [Caenorhabditis bovis]